MRFARQNGGTPIVLVGAPDGFTPTIESTIRQQSLPGAVYVLGGGVPKDTSAAHLFDSGFDVVVLESSEQVRCARVEHGSVGEC